MDSCDLYLQVPECGGGRHNDLTGGGEGRGGEEGQSSTCRYMYVGSCTTYSVH